jgi:hypothetical protein
MQYAVEMGSVFMIYIPAFIKIGSDIGKLMGEGGNRTIWRSHEAALGNRLKNTEQYNFQLHLL